MYNLHFLAFLPIFAPTKTMGLTGFDSEMSLCVSMQ